MAGAQNREPGSSEEAPAANRVTLPGGAVRPDLQAPRRGTLFGRRGAVASGQPLASLAGLDVLRAGGNAVDASIAISAVMIVVQPYSSHIGGDAFALIRTADGETVALNAGGRAPMAATAERYANGIPRRGAPAVAVPGLVDAWCAVHGRFGTKPLAELLAPAISLAREGFPVSQGVARVIAVARELLAGDPGCSEVFMSDGPPQPGTLLRQPELARTLERVAANGGEEFRSGETGRRITAYLKERGGSLADEDLTADQAVWGDPLRIDYRGWTVYGQPLPSQGFMTLEALRILEGFDLASEPIVSADVIHRAVESMRLCFDDRDAYAGDPDVIDVPIERLLSKEYAAQQRERIGATSGGTVATKDGDTTSFAVADDQGNVVSFIQSVFDIWGAAVLVPGTGVLLNNRMTAFSLEPASPNQLQPGKRTVHTLNTWLIESGDGALYAGGTPGADTQVQVNLQVITGIADWGLGPQSAIDAPKWALTAHAGRPLRTALEGDGGVLMESRFPEETAAELERRGHPVVRAPAWETALSRSQIVGRDAAGILSAASDLRAEGCALTW